VSRNQETLAIHPNISYPIFAFPIVKWDSVKQQVLLFVQNHILILSGEAQRKDESLLTLP